jgi:hypothetical protein
MELFFEALLGFISGNMIPASGLSPGRTSDEQ